ncbi:MAG: hypothetical protein ACRDJ5_11765 [Actinomycetota bacterium]
MSAPAACPVLVPEGSKRSNREIAGDEKAIYWEIAGDEKAIYWEIAGTE